jgi:hypothetical protein
VDYVFSSSHHGHEVREVRLRSQRRRVRASPDPLTGEDGRQLSPRALGRAMRTARKKVQAFPLRRAAPAGECRRCRRYLFGLRISGTANAVFEFRSVAMGGLVDVRGWRRPAGGLAVLLALLCAGCGSGPADPQHVELDAGPAAAAFDAPVTRMRRSPWPACW